MSTSWPKIALLALTVATAGLGAEFAAAERGYYKWLDARGNPQHSDRPPPAGVAYEFVSTETGLRRRVTNEESSDAAAPPPPAVVRSASPTGETQAAIKKDPVMCDKAKANLDTLNSNARVRIRDDDGIRYLTEEEKDVQRERAQNLIAVHCSS